MLRATGLVFLAAVLAACSAPASPQTPVPQGTLGPYLTATPSATPAQAAGLALAETSLPTPTPSVYVVEAGDTMGGIALKFGVSLDDLAAANPEVSPNSMSIGTELRIPGLPANPSGAATPSPVPAPVEQLACYPTADRGLWCFVLVRNDTTDLLENLSAQVSLGSPDGSPLASGTAVSALNILPPGEALPLAVFFPPPVTGGVIPSARLLTGVRLQPGDARYLPAAFQNTLVEVSAAGLSAQASGRVRLADGAQAANTVWIAGVAYDRSGRVVGVRRWESSGALDPGAELPFAFTVSSVAGEISRVEFVLEARP